MATVNASSETRLPRQVRMQMQRISELTAETQRASEGAPPPPIEEPAAQPPAAPGAPTPPPPPPSPAEPPPPELQQIELRPFNDPALETDPRAADPAYWRQRLSVMQGKLREARTEAAAREAELLSKIESLENQLQAKAPSQPAAVDIATMFTPEQVEALGEDQAKAIAAAAITAARQQVDATLAERSATQQTQQARETKQEQAHRQRVFYDALGDLVPNWRAIDARDDWRQWLGEIDPDTGRDRQSALTATINAGDAAACAEVFADFLRSKVKRPTPPVAPGSSAGTPAAPPAPGGRDLSLVPPTQEEIAAFYKRASVNGGRGVTAQERAEFDKRLALL